MPSYLLDRISKKDIRLNKQWDEAIQAYYCKHYSYFSYQRSLIFSDLKDALARNCKPMEIKIGKELLIINILLPPFLLRVVY